MSSIFDSQAFNANLFFPRQDPSPAPANSEDYYIDATKEVRIHARRHPNPNANLSMLFFHGNGEIVSDYDNLAGLFSGLGVELTIADFRGYGKSSGIPTLRSALEDSHKILDFLKDKKLLKKKVCVMGRSLGSAPTIELCSKRSDIQACILESGYADPIPLVERRGLKIDKTTPEENAVFNNSQKISSVKCPTLIMHGEDDFLISPKEAKLNYENAGAKVKRLEILEGVGHNDMMMAPDHSYFTTLKDFIDSL
ncbi:MAG: alpha/beta hydrolase [Nitrospinae bacterium]|nr:alpha/beta hydrolase [Nitrospinota bacterium]MZH15586.1 alpha/beta hydrolase [Nitrospinota bacterium]